jgi:Mg/Co/Ni transporter MgtE
VNALALPSTSRSLSATSTVPGAQRQRWRRGISATPEEQTAAFYRSLGDKRLTALVKGLESEDASTVLRRLSDGEAADVLDELDPDDAAYVIALLIRRWCDVIWSSSGSSSGRSA